MRVLGTMSFKRLVFDDLEEMVLPADLLVDPANENVEAPQDPRFQIWKKMDSFVIRAADVGTLIDRLRGPADLNSVGLPRHLPDDLYEQV